MVYLRAFWVIKMYWVRLHTMQVKYTFVCSTLFIMERYTIRLGAGYISGLNCLVNFTKSGINVWYFGGTVSDGDTPTLGGRSNHHRTPCHTKWSSSVEHEMAYVFLLISVIDLQSIAVFNESLSTTVPK